jgi:hypothetical protein
MKFLYSYFSCLYKDIIDIIIDYSRPTRYEEINNYLLLINYKNDYNDEYNRWIRFSKYVKFKDNQFNNNEFRDNRFREINNNWAGGYLLDLMSSGCTLPFGRGSREYFDQYFREDLKYILKNYDNCLTYPQGILRCREGISPLGMACININVPISIIDILLKNGANINDYHYLNGYKIELLKDLNYHIYANNLNRERTNQIVQIFINNGVSFYFIRSSHYE